MYITSINQPPSPLLVLYVYNYPLTCAELIFHQHYGITSIKASPLSHESSLQSTVQTVH